MRNPFKRNNMGNPFNSNIMENRILDKYAYGISKERLESLIKSINRITDFLNENDILLTKNDLIQMANRSWAETKKIEYVKKTAKSMGITYERAAKVNDSLDFVYADLWRAANDFSKPYKEIEEKISQCETRFIDEKYLFLDNNMAALAENAIENLQVHCSYPIETSAQREVYKKLLEIGNQIKALGVAPLEIAKALDEECTPTIFGINQVISIIQIKRSRN